GWRCSSRERRGSTSGSITATTRPSSTSAGTAASPTRSKPYPSTCVGGRPRRGGPTPFGFFLVSSPAGSTLRSSSRTPRTRLRKAAIFRLGYPANGPLLVPACAVEDGTQRHRVASGGSHEGKSGAGVSRGLRHGQERRGVGRQRGARDSGGTRSGAEGRAS